MNVNDVYVYAFKGGVCSGDGMPHLYFVKGNCLEMTFFLLKKNVIVLCCAPVLLPF